MANEGVTIEQIQKDILEQAGLKSRDELPITLEATWGGETYQVGQKHPSKPYLILEIHHDADEIHVYALPEPAPNGTPEKDRARYNPTRFVLTKTARTSVLDVMTLDVFVDAIAGELERLSFSLYPPVEEPEPKKAEKSEPPTQPPSKVEPTPAAQ